MVQSALSMLAMASTVWRWPVNWMLAESWGECGGSAMSAACHVYIDEAWIDQIEPPGEVEEEMLEWTTSERRQTSRLSCQILLESSKDGLTVHIPATQSKHKRLKWLHANSVPSLPLRIFRKQVL